MTEYVIRFNRRQRLEHIGVMSLFILLSVTGLPQKFYQAGWAHGLVDLFGGIRTMVKPHERVLIKPNLLKARR